MAKSKEFIKSINAAMIIGYIMLYGSALILNIIYFGISDLSWTKEELIIHIFITLFFFLIPAVVLQIIRKKFWVKKHSDVLQK